jgi:hypothetical protein
MLVDDVVEPSGSGAHASLSSLRLLVLIDAVYHLLVQIRSERGVGVRNRAGVEVPLDFLALRALFRRQCAYQRKCVGDQLRLYFVVQG